MDRKSFDTPFFRARCNSMLAFLALKGKMHDVGFEDDDVIHKLMADGKVKYAAVGNFLVAVAGAKPYPNDNTAVSNRPHPLVLELAAENPANENFLKVYHKNKDYCAVEPLRLAA